MPEARAPGTGPAVPGHPAGGTAPARPALVLTALIAVAAVANLNLSVANVALPSIGVAFEASQTSLNLVAVGYSLGLAASVLYLGALGDRYGRKLMLVLGVALSIPACLLAALAPSVEVLVLARLLGGLSAGMAYPTTLALITALWAGSARTRPIALWSGLGGAISALGPLLAGWVLGSHAWGWVFLLTLPLAVVALVLAVLVVPGHVNEGTYPVDQLGGVLSVVTVASLVLAINFAAVPGAGPTAAGLTLLTLVAGVAFVFRQRRAQPPLYDLRVAARRTFWVAGVAGVIVFGSLMGAMFVGQQFLQNVLGYSPLASGLAILPAVGLLVTAAPVSARLIERFGSRTTLLAGFSACLAGFLTMLLAWEDGSPYWPIGLAYALVGLGVGLAGTPASRALTGSVPVRRAGMASGTADLQRDLGGAIMQSILGALLTAGYAAAFARAIGTLPAGDQQQIPEGVTAQLQKSFDGAVAIAQQHPQYASQIIEAARTSFVDGANWAYGVGAIAVLAGAALVALAFPRRRHEAELLAAFAAEDARPATATAAGDPPTS